MQLKKIKKENGIIVYRARVYLGTDTITGRKVNTSVTARTKTECKQKAKAKKEEFIKNGSTTFKTVSVKTVNNLLDLWFATYKHEVKEQTYKMIDNIAKNHIRKPLGAVKLDKLTTPALQHWINNIARNFKQHHTVFSILNRAIKYAISLQIMTSNPLANVIKPKTKADSRPNECKYLEPEQLKQFLDYLDSLPPTYANIYDTVLYKLLIATGCRIGEVVALEWSDIDLNNGTIIINKTYSHRVKKVTEPKTRASIRIVNIDKATILALRLYKNTQAVHFKEIGYKSSVVFSTGLSEYRAHTVLQRKLGTHFKRAGLPKSGFHIFRHTHASLLLNAGITPKELQHRLGHSKVSMTLDVYSHLFENTQKESVVYFEKAIDKIHAQG